MATIRYDVPAVVQGPSPTCWLACFRMLALFRRHVGRPLNPLAEVLLDPGYVARLQRLNRGLDPRRFAQIAHEFGLSALDVPGLTRLSPGDLPDPFAAFDILRRRGPFTLGGLLRGTSPHAIVICGATDSADADIEFIDPRLGDHRHHPFMRFQAGFPPDGGPLFVF